MDQQQLLAEAVAAASAPQHGGQGYLHAFTQPVPPDQGIFERAEATIGGKGSMHQHLVRIINGTKLRRRYGPSLEQAPYWSRRGADEWRLATHSESDRLEYIRGLAEVRMNIDGRGHLFVGRATDQNMRARTWR